MEKFQGTASSQTKLWIHFAHQNPREIILILEEGNKPHPRCPQCEMFVPQEALNWAQLTSGMCRRGTERKRRRIVVEETEEWTGRVLLAYGTPLKAVPLFKYLGQTLLSSNDDRSTVE